MGEDTRYDKMTPGEIQLRMKLQRLEHEMQQVQKENVSQATKERQEMHYRTLFGASADKDGLVQKVAKLMTFMKVSLWAYSIIGAALLAYFGKVIIGLLQAGPPGSP